jgi:hypothetical protein
MANLNQTRNGGALVGSSTAAIGFGGIEPPFTGKTEFWNGSSWSELAELSSNRFQMGGAGTSGAGALSFGGAPNPVATSTEEWTASLGNKTITAS